MVLLVYCAAIAAASIGGGVLTQRLRVTHLGMQLLMSLVGGLILGVAILHMLPHAVAAAPGSLGTITVAMLLGVLGMLLLMRLFHVHQHQPDEIAETHVGCGHDHGSHDHGDHDHSHHDHSHHGVRHEPAGIVAPLVSIADPRGGGERVVAGESPAARSTAATPAERAAIHAATMRWFGLAIGMTVHSLLDGIAVAAYVAADRHDHASSDWHWPGLGIFLAILLHKPLDASSIVWLMRSDGWSRGAMVVVNLGFAAMTPIGVLLFHWGVLGSSLASETMLAATLGFSAGVFLCISLSDILPEVQFHSHDRVKLTTALLVGVLLAWAIGLAEPKSAHSIAPAEVHGTDDVHAHP